MSDIVERLRRQVSESPYDGFVSPLEAAAEIERLEADNERLMASLRKLHDIIDPGADDAPMPSSQFVRSALAEARAALEGKYD